MRNSSNDIYLSGEYFSNNPHWGVDDSVWKAEVITNLLKKSNVLPKTVTEVGCGAGAILEALSNSFPETNFVGYDISPQAIKIASQRATDRIQFIQEDFCASIHPVADLLMVIDVVEHVDNFYDMLRKLSGQANNFIFHIPLDLSCRTILKPHILLQQRSSVGHIHYFSKEMVEWMLADTGYQIVDWVYTKPVVDVRPPDNFKRRVKKALRNISFGIHQDISAKLWGSYSMMILAK